MDIVGSWYPAGSSSRQGAKMRLEGERFLLRTDDGHTLEGGYGSIEISPRIGNISSKITFSDQSVFETLENDNLDRWIGSQQHGFKSNWPHRLESSWHWIVVALAAVVIFIFSMTKWGLPWTSQVIAKHMPDVIVEHISNGAFELLESWILEPSALPEEQRQTLIDRFSSRLAEGDTRYALHFRKLGMPNALALPSGDLIVTDSFVSLATEEEFDAVMLHEIGHVKLRHGMQQLVRSSIMTFIVAMIVGEPSGLEEVIVALPVFLMQSHYSRAHESEADDFALNAMMQKNIDPIHFATIMEKLGEFEVEQENAAQGMDDEGGIGVLDYLSSHPATSDRIEKARELSLQFNE